MAYQQERFRSFVTERRQMRQVLQRIVITLRVIDEHRPGSKPDAGFGSSFPTAGARRGAAVYKEKAAFSRVLPSR